MSDLMLYQKHGVALLTRQDTYGDDQRVLDEALSYDIGTEPIRYAIDIGSHIGGWTCYVKSRWPNAEIIAYEPEADNFRVLQANTYNLEGVQAYNNPVGYDDVRPVVALHPDHTTCHRVVRANEVPEGLAVQETHDYLTLEVILTEAMIDWDWPCVDVLKIDAEGAEVDIFEHCTDESLLRIRRLVGEFHNGYSRFMSTIGLRLTGLGFTVTAETDPNAHSTFLAERL